LVTTPTRIYEDTNAGQITHPKFTDLIADFDDTTNDLMA
jgi:hypothetical protein